MEWMNLCQDPRIAYHLVEVAAGLLTSGA
jgi:hypothetical protein